MEVYLYLVIGLFILMLFISIYFRLRVIKSYKVLKKEGIEFNSSHFFNAKKMEAEIIPRYPQRAKEIRRFVKDIKLGVTLSSTLIFLIFTFAWILKNKL